jgi:hypothetical protein
MITQTYINSIIAQAQRAAADYAYRISRQSLSGENPNALWVKLDVCLNGATNLINNYGLTDHENQVIIDRLLTTGGIGVYGNTPITFTPIVVTPVPAAGNLTGAITSVGLVTSADNFVPYSGATGPIDLNGQTLQNTPRLRIGTVDPALAAYNFVSKDPGAGFFMWRYSDTAGAEPFVVLRSGTGALGSATSGGGQIRGLMTEEGLKFTDVSGLVEYFRINNNKNLGLGVTTFGSNGSKMLAVGLGTAPTTSPANAFQMYAADITAGNTAPHFRTEAGDVIKLFTGAALTTALTSITHTSPGAPDYAIQTVQLAGYGFATADEGNTVLSVILNLQTRINELEARLQSCGIIA